MSQKKPLAPARQLRLFVILLCLLCSIASAQKRATYTNPVIAGDFPDPSVIRVGDDYWATTTSGEWSPVFLLMHSRDLVRWEARGAVFPNRPAWAARNFWAPELQQHGARFYVYYTARKRNGPLCVAVASADKPQGPYTDHGALVCQEVGSIDAVTTTDEHGELYLIWKEDGNSRNEPTPLWAQKLSADGTRLVGVRKELFRNNPATWEGGVVEGAFVVRRGDWFYLFYSGNACCGRKCNYALGVARSRKLLGTWEKNPANPILAENETWQCPGHGSIVTDKGGRDYLLYHAYRKSDVAFRIGREALLDEVKWETNGWPSINGGKGPSKSAPRPIASGVHLSQDSFYDEFDAPALAASWQWPQWSVPIVAIETERGGRLRLSATDKRSKDALAAMITQPVTSGSYTATTQVNLAGMQRGALVGLSAFGDPENALGVAVGDGEIKVWNMESKARRTVAAVKMTAAAQVMSLRMSVRDGVRYRFAYSVDGRQWTPLGDEVDGSHLDSVRIALTAGGGAVGKFEWVRIEPTP
ncbi:MAG TPA: family 43 glycosylhydrolase [Pyrinomonadaceae bacterium]|nr:family 43 glycosylhydrolase [Pyrinomonadaceae bacterium]